MTSPRQVMTSYQKKLHSHVQEKILGKVTKGISKIGYGSGVTQQKVEIIVEKRWTQVRGPEIGCRQSLI